MVILQENAYYAAVTNGYNSVTTYVHINIFIHSPRFWEKNIHTAKKENRPFFVK